MLAAEFALMTGAGWVETMGAAAMGMWLRRRRQH